MNFLCFDPSISVEWRLYSVTPSSLCIKFGVVWFFLSDILQFIQSAIFPQYPSIEWKEPFWKVPERGLCVVLFILRNWGSSTTSNVFCRKIDGSGIAKGKIFQLQTLENIFFWKNEEVTNGKLKVGCILECQIQTSFAKFGGRHIEFFSFRRNVCCERKVNFYYYINSTVVSWFLRNLHCPSVLRPLSLIWIPTPPPETSLFQFALHHEFIQPFFVCVKTWLFTHSWWATTTVVKALEIWYFSCMLNISLLIKCNKVHMATRWTSRHGWCYSGSKI